VDGAVKIGVGAWWWGSMLDNLTTHHFLLMPSCHWCISHWSIEVLRSDLLQQNCQFTVYRATVLMNCFTDRLPW